MNHSVSCGMIRMSLQWEIDWQILEGAKIGAQQAARVSTFAKAAIRRTLHIWCRHLYRSSVAISSGPIDCNPVRKARLLASVNRELRRAHVP